MSSQMDDQIRKALFEVENRRVAAIEGSGYEPFAPSPRYQRTISKLVRRTSRGKTFSRVIAILIACVIFLSMTVVAYAAGESIIEFITNIVGEWFHVDYELQDIKNAPQSIETIYIPQSMPEMYALREQEVYHRSMHTTWENGSGGKVVLSQYVLSAEVHIKAEGTGEITIGGIRALYGEYEDLWSYYWYYDNYQFSLSFFGEEPQITDVERIVASLVPTEK